MADISSLLGGLGVGGFIGQAIVKLELDTAKYNAEMKAAQANTTASANAMSGGLGKFSAFANAAFLGVGAAAVVGIGYAIKAGSDLNEQLNKTRVVFEDSADSVIKFSETTAESLGIAQAEALTAAGNFGQLFDAAGLATEAAAEMSIKMTALGADIGSFNNIPVTEALDKLRSGLSGEAEPLRQVGVFLSEARVKAEAYSSGIADVGEELTDAQKIQARYNIILDDTTKAQGDFGRTVGESVPNQIKTLTAELKDLAAEIGTDLLPVVLEAIKVLKVLAEVAAAPFETPAIDVAFNVERGKEYAQGLREIAEAYNLAAGADEQFHRASEALAEQFGVSQASVEQRVYDMLALQDATHAAELADRGAADAAQKLKAGMDLGSVAARELADNVEEVEKSINRFAGKSEKDFEEWEAQIKESFDTYVLSLEESEDMQAETAAGFRAATNQMLQDSRDLSRAMREIAGEKWINEEYVAFLSEQGPEWLIGFAAQTEDQQRRSQEAWKKSVENTDEYKSSLDKITGTLVKLDGGKSQHTIEIIYKYVDFDPTKPGMQPHSSGTKGQI